MADVVIAAVALLCFTPVIQASPEDPKHIGCFSTDFARSHEHYNIRYTLTWEDAVSFCNHRLTVYMGVQEENSSSKFNFVYCGNDIKQHSEPVSSSHCRPCVHNPDRSCGGENALSLYQLRDSTPLTFLLLFSTYITKTKEDKTSSNLLPSGSNMHAVDFLYTEDDLFFLKSSSINRLYFNYFSMEYRTTTSVILSQSSYIKYLSVDWLNRKVYWVDWNPDKIYQSDLEDDSRQLILTHKSVIHYLTIDPYNRLLFYLQQDVDLFKYSLETKTIKSYVKNGLLRFTKIKRVAVSVRHELIFVIGSVDDSDTMHLLSMDYEATKVTHLYSGMELADPRGLDVYHDQVVWLSFRSSRIYLYKCKLTPRCEPGDVKLIDDYTTDLQDMKTYYPEKQAPSERYLCANMSCSHGCRASSLFTAECLCPETHNRTCHVELFGKTGTAERKLKNSGHRETAPLASNVLLEGQNMNYDRKNTEWCTPADSRILPLYVGTVALLFLVVIVLFIVVFFIQLKQCKKNELFGSPRQIVKYVKSPREDTENINIYDELHSYYHDTGERKNMHK